MAFQYSIDHVEPAEVHGDLLRVWCDNLPVNRDKAEAKYQWTYLEAPQRPDGVFVLRARSGTRTDQTRTVGTAGLTLRSFFAGGRMLTAGLLADLAVDRPHRTALPAIRLVREVRRQARERHDLVYGYPNHAADSVFLRCGYHKLGTMERYAAVLHYAPYVRRILDLPLLPELAGAAIDVLHMSTRAPRLVRAALRFRLEWLDQVDARFDDLWQRARHEYPLVGQRDARFLRWRFVDHPTGRFAVAALTERGAARRLRAYAVVQRHGSAAFLRDVFGHVADLAPLLDLLLPRLWAQGATSASMQFLGARRVVDLLAAHGFKPRHDARVIVAEAGAARGDLAPLVENPETWHLTDADEDI